MGEFDTRVGQTLGARTYAELAALTAGVSAGRTAARPVGGLGRGRRAPLGKAASSCAGVIMAAVRRAGTLQLIAVAEGQE